MPCLIGCLALSFPRLALALVWMFGGGYFMRAYDHWLWPLLGFFFLPLTTLTFAFGINSLGQPGEMSPLGWLLTLLALLFDLGLLTNGGRNAKRWHRSRSADEARSR